MDGWDGTHYLIGTSCKNGGDPVRSVLQNSKNI